MILVDTTIWIEFFKSNPVFVNDMESLLENKNVITIEPIFAELLYGSRSDIERNIADNPGFMYFGNNRCKIKC